MHKQSPLPQFFPFHIIVASPDYGRNCRPKHIVVNAMNIFNP